ncbi:MAG: hypothetical protein Kow0068_00200 [Marinilabiliales bacterium]
MKIGFISDIHEDIISLDKAIQHFNSLDIDYIVCLGDITGYSYPHYNYKSTRDASECVNIIKKNCKHVVPGNHDLFAIKKTPSISRNFNYPADWYQLPVNKREKLSKNKVWFYDKTDLQNNLTEKNINFLKSLNEFEIINAGNNNILISHFIYPDISGSSIKFPRSIFFFRKHFKFMKQNNCNISFCGHGHYNGAMIVNKLSFNIFKPGKYCLSDKPKIIIVPCVAKSKSINAITIFNTFDNSLELIEISK